MHTKSVFQIACELTHVGSIYVRCCRVNHVRVSRMHHTITSDGECKRAGRRVSRGPEKHHVLATLKDERCHGSIVQVVRAPFEMLVRSAAHLWIAALLTCIPAAAQFNEPILTRTALPNPAGTVSLKFDFVTPIGQTTGVSSQAIPVSRLDVGLGRGFETVFQLPLLRVSEADGSSVLAGGQFSVALRYLLAGSPTAKYAISVSGRLEVATGNSTVVGNSTQLMPMMLAEWHAVPRLLLRSNIAWNTTVGGTLGKIAYFEHANAVVWLASRHFMPVFEVVGGTNTLTGNTQLVVQPEVIVARSQHLELKTGLAIALVPTPRYAIQSQVAWFWGKRRLP
jgi:hypothetical protein